MTESSDTALWRQAIEICESLTDLNRQQIIEKIESMSLEPALLEKVMRMLENMSASNPLLDEHDYQALMENLKEGKHLIGKKVDNYTIKRLIAQGGMSTVYEGELLQASHQKSVAIKLLSPYGITEKAIELFNREQMILSQLSHPSIVSFHHSGVTQEGTHYLVMEYIDDAENIVEHCNNKDLSRQAIVTTIKELCEVFSYAHDKQIIHRDIKPNNILVDSAGYIKVIDFGIGRFEQHEQKTLTQVFTPDVAAPEQLLGQGVSVQTDVFSLGALLLQLLVKQHPLPKTDINNYHPQDDVKHINALLKSSNLDTDLQNIIKTAMHIDPKLRYANMQAFADDLDNWLNHKPISASAASTFYRIKKFYVRNKALSVLASVGVLVALIAVGFIAVLEFQKRQVTAQRDVSFALIEAMIDQANPVINEGVVDSDLLVKNLQELATSQAALLYSDPQLSGFFYNELGALYHSKGLYQESLDSYQKAFSSIQQYTQPEEEAYLEKELTIAHLLETTGRYEEAKALGYALLEKLDQLPGVDPKHRLSVYDLLSKVHDYLFETDAALMIGDEARDWLERHPNIDAAKQSSMYNSLAVMSRKTGKLEDAEKLYNKAIDLLRNNPDEPIRLSSVLVNLAILKGRSGDYVGSEKLFLEAIDVAKNIDPGHPHVGMSYLPYATLLRVTGRYQESKKISEQALVILLQSGEDKHIAEAYERLVRINMTLFDFDDVAKHLIAAKKLQNTAWKLDHPEVLGRTVMVMWLLYDFKESPLMNRLTTYIDQQELTLTIETPEYKNYQVVRALVDQQALHSDTDSALFTRIDAELSGLSTSEQQNLLAAYLNEVKDNTVTSAYLRLLLAAVNQDKSGSAEVCQRNQGWFGTYQVPLKWLVINQCKQQLGEQLDAELLAYHQRWNAFHLESSQVLASLVEHHTQAK